MYNELLEINPYQYDTVIIISQNVEEYNAEKKDTDTLIILMMLRQLKQHLGIDNKKTKIITQILDADNQNLIAQTDIDVFISSNRLIDKIIAQISEQPDIKEVYDDLFEYEGSEIYIKPLKYYVNQENISSYSFVDLSDLAFKRNQICIGICLKEHSKDFSKNFGVILNPSKNSKYELSPDDYLVVLAEGEN